MANPYLPVVARAAARYRVPADLLAALTQAESNFDPHAVSPAGAQGIDQFMPGTWSGSWNPFRSQSPFNPQAAIPAAALYLSRLLRQNHGSVPLALAAYNAGQGAVNAAGGQIPRIPETQNYVKTILSRRSRFPGLAAGQVPGGAPTATPPAGTPGPSPTQPTAAPGLQTIDNPAYQTTLNLQNLIQQNSENAHIPQLTLPLPPMTITQPIAPPAPSTTTTPSPTATPTPGNATTPPTRTGQFTRPVNSVNLIGFPYAGTHKPGATTPASWESDNAIDIGVPTGTPIYATADGVIGSRIGAFTNGNPYTAGLRVHLVTKGNEFYYGHLSRLVVHAGQHVRAGQIIGYSGSANGVQHLHFASRSGNPVNLFGYRGR